MRFSQARPVAALDAVHWGAMFKRLWEYFLLTMGVTPKGAERPREDKWAAARRIKEQEEHERRAREEQADREKAG
jgi:hypothetical protein